MASANLRPRPSAWQLLSPLCAQETTPVLAGTAAAMRVEEPPDFDMHLVITVEVVALLRATDVHLPLVHIQQHDEKESQ
jgi:hypothetical protein